MARLKTSLICLVLMAFVKSSQAQQHDPTLSAQSNISMAEAAAGAADAKRWMQMQNLGRTAGSGCSEDNCVESCEENWEKNGEHCYLWSTDKKNWTDAEDFCQREGGHLASVHSNEIFDFVLEGMNRTGLDTALVSVWIGGNDIEAEGTWKWVDCSPWNLTFWAPGEPNDAVRSENCLQHVLSLSTVPQLNTKWNDMHCRSELGFLCSKSICSGGSVKSPEAPEEVTTVSALTGNSSEPTGSAVTGDSVMWKPASISLFLLLLIFFF